MSILVTGGAGYIGSHTLVELLTQTAYNVVSIDNLSNADGKAYAAVAQLSDVVLQPPSERFTTYQVDLCDYKETAHIFAAHAFVGVIHFAAYKSVGESVNDPLKYYHNNLTALVNVLQLCAEHDVQQFIFSSSCSVYGNVAPEDLPVTEATPLSVAQSPYAATKQMGETIIQDFSKSHPGFQAVLLRYFNPVGAHLSALLGEDPINRPNCLVPLITLAATRHNPLTIHGNDYPTRDGTCVRDYIHVCDVARAHVQALTLLQKQKQQHNPAATAAQTQIRIYNLATGKGTTVQEALEAYERVTGVPVEYQVGPRRPGDVVAIYADPSLAAAELDWRCEYSLDDMMRTAHKWQQKLDLLFDDMQGVNSRPEIGILEN